MLIVDTGPLVALGDRDDSYHQACRELLETDPGPLITIPLVIAEAAYLLARVLGSAAELALIEMIRDRTLAIEVLTDVDWDRVHQLVGTYSDLPLEVTDAGVIAVAERLGPSRIATLDRRHFSVIRPSHHVPAPRAGSA